MYTTMLLIQEELIIYNSMDISDMYTTILLIQEELITYNSMDISSAHLNVGFWVADDSVHTAERERKEDLCSQDTRPSVCMHASQNHVILYPRKQNLNIHHLGYLQPWIFIISSEVVQLGPWNRQS